MLILLNKEESGHFQAKNITFTTAFKKMKQQDK